jgi:hypothetical protein
MSIEDDIRGMFKWIEEHPELGKVDVCIPNAGLSFDKSLLDGTFFINRGGSGSLFALFGPKW